MNNIVLTTVVTNDHNGIRLVDELPSGDNGEPAVRVYRMPDGSTVINVLSDEPFTLSPSITEWIKECLND